MVKDYIVQIDPLHCTCEDFRRRGALFCKHIAAVVNYGHASFADFPHHFLQDPLITPDVNYLKSFDLTIGTKTPSQTFHVPCDLTSSDIAGDGEDILPQGSFLRFLSLYSIACYLPNLHAYPKLLIAL